MADRSCLPCRKMRVLMSWDPGTFSDKKLRCPKWKAHPRRRVLGRWVEVL